MGLVGRSCVSGDCGVSRREGREEREKGMKGKKGKKGRKD